MRHRSIVGGAGSGKTTRLVSHLQGEPVCDTSVPVAGTLYLTPLRDQREALKRDLPERVHPRIHTPESLAYHISNASPDPTHLPDDNRSHYEWTEREQEAMNRYFSELRTDAFEVMNSAGARLFDGISRIMIDDFEALNPDAVQSIAALVRASGASLVVAGDPYRYMSDFSVGDTLEAYEQHLREFLEVAGIDPGGVHHEELTVDHRSPHQVHKLASAFLRAASPEAKMELGWQENDFAAGVSYRAPVIRFVRDRDTEYGHLLRELRRISTKRSVLVQSHSRSNVKELRRRLKSDGFGLDGRIRVETVFRATSFEADVVFVLHAVFPRNGDSDSAVRGAALYSAVSRAKRRVEIFTAQPYRGVLEGGFGSLLKGAAKITKSQGPVQSSFRRLPKIDLSRRRNFTERRLAESTIDSIDLSVSASDAPFVPLPPTEAQDMRTANQSNYARAFFHAPRGVPIRVERIGRYHRFEFHDLATLKKHGYSDEQILKFAANYVLGHFDWRIEVNRVRVSRIDLAHYALHPVERTRAAFEEFVSEADTSRASSLYLTGSRDGAPGRTEISPEEFAQMDSSDLRGRTLYANFRTRKNKLTFRIYRPLDKQNRNRIHRAGYKIEAELSGDTVRRDYALGENHQLDHLLGEVASDTTYFKRVLDRLHQRQFRLEIGIHDDKSGLGRTATRRRDGSTRQAGRAFRRGLSVKAGFTVPLYLFRPRLSAVGRHEQSLRSRPATSISPPALAWGTCPRATLILQDKTRRDVPVPIRPP